VRTTSARRGRAIASLMAAAALVCAPVAAFADEGTGSQSGDQQTQSGDSAPDLEPTVPTGGTDTDTDQPGAPAETVAPAVTPRSDAVGAQATTTSTINLLAITDFHGHFAPTTSDPGAPALSCQFTKASAGYDSTFRLSVGDNIGGSAYASAIQKDQPTIEILNAMGIQVSAVGNHEFDNGAQKLADRINGAPMGSDAPSDDPAATWIAPDFPYLWANLDGMPDTDHGGNYTILRDEASGADIAFVGAVTDELPSLVSPAGIAGIEIADPATTINRIADELKDGDASNGEADVVVGLIHKDMANTVTSFSPAVDAVFGGHSHVTYSTGEPVPAVQGGSFGQDLGQIVLTVDEGDDGTYSVTGDTEKIYDAATIAGCTDQVDPTVQDLTDAAVATATELGGQPAVKVGGSFYRGSAVLREGASPAEARGVESTMGNLVANAVRDASDLYMPSGKADIGVTNAGGLRADLVPDGNGMLTKGQLFTAQPFGNEMAYVSLTGAQFVEALEDQWQPPLPSGEPPSRPVLKLAVSDNVDYGFDPTAARGSHILWVDVDGEPIDLDATYTVAGNNFLLTGGDNFAAFAGAGAVNTGFIDLDLFTQYLERRAGAGDPASPYELSDNAIAIENAADLPDTFEAGRTYTLDLSSLSFTEDSMQASSISVCWVSSDARDVLATADVDNSDLVDGTAVALDDRFGAASVTFTVPDAVAEGDQLSICNIEAPFATNDIILATADAELTPEPGQSGSAPPQPSAVPTKPGLATTGADGGVLAGGLALLVAGATLTLARRRARRD